MSSVDFTGIRSAIVTACETALPNTTIRKWPQRKADDLDNNTTDNVREGVQFGAYSVDIADGTFGTTDGRRHYDYTLPGRITAVYAAAYSEANDTAFDAVEARAQTMINAISDQLETDITLSGAVYYVAVTEDLDQELAGDQNNTVLFVDFRVKARAYAT